MNKQVMRYALSLGAVLMLNGCGCDCLGDESMKNKKEMTSCCGGCESTVEKKVAAEQAPATSDHVKADSGLEYTILTAGASDAPVAKKGQLVAVHYTGWLDENGKQGEKFDSSVDRGEPFVFPLGAGWVIKGWDQGVQGMKIGEKRRLVIPAHLGYGSRGAPPVIKPNATLIFDVELLQVQDDPESESR
jgi:FKBP-type peptidyl-prolyl cis-trans isomerase